MGSFMITRNRNFLKHFQSFDSGSELSCLQKYLTNLGCLAPQSKKPCVGVISETTYETG